MARRKKVELSVSFVEMTDDEIFEFRDNFEVAKKHLYKQWADDVLAIVNEPKFDEYSFSGKRKLDKIAKKYADDFDGALYIEEVLEEEIKKREKYNEQQLYLRKGGYKGTAVSVEEFIEKEQVKTDRYKINKD